MKHVWGVSITNPSEFFKTFLSENSVNFNSNHVKWFCQWVLAFILADCSSMISLSISLLRIIRLWDHQMRILIVWNWHNWCPTLSILSVTADYLTVYNYWSTLGSVSRVPSLPRSIQSYLPVVLYCTFKNWNWKDNINNWEKVIRSVKPDNALCN